MRWQLKKHSCTRRKSSVGRSVSRCTLQTYEKRHRQSQLYFQTMSFGFFRKPKHAARFGQRKNCLEIHLWQTVVCRLCTTTRSLTRRPALCLTELYELQKLCRHEGHKRHCSVDWRGSGQCVVVSNFVFHPAINQALLTSRDNLIRVLPAVVTHLPFYPAVIFNLLVAMVLSQHCQHDNYSVINSPDMITIRVRTVTNYTPRQLIFRPTVA